MLSDDQGWNGLSVAMHPDFDASRGENFRTPNLEAFARQGMRFSAAYAPAPVCSPTRISLQTGKNPARLHWTKAAPPVEGQRLLEPKLIKQLSSQEITIGELLQSAGYATAHYGKWHIEGGGPGAHGYDEHDGNTGNENAFRFVDPNPVDIFGMAERAAKFMEKNRDEGRPFYIQLSWNALHAPELARQATQAKYTHLVRENNSKQASVAAITEDLDEGVGRVLTAIHELGLSQNTYVIYMSDNGSGGGKRGGLSGGKGSLWEGGIRVPFLIRGPGILPNTWCHTPIVGYDLLPTFCQWAGVASDRLPLSIDGGSIDSLLHGGGDGIVHRPRPELVFHFPHHQGNDGPHSALRVDDWKLIFFYEDERMSLFDLSKDLSERQDLAESMPEKAHQLKLQLNEQLVTMDAQFPTANPNFDPQEIPPPRQSKGPRNVPKPKGGKNRENKSEKPKENP
jgi:arylsulfatase A-like enzyme